jgi:5-methylthioribose kinase
MPNQLDIEDSAALRAWLQGTGRIPPAREFSIRNLAGGVSNRTVLVEFSDGGGWVLKQALAKLRVAVDWFSDPARIEREALGMKWLAKLAPANSITELIFEDAQQHVLAMQAVPQPHENLKTLFLSGRADLTFGEQFGTLLGEIHRRGYEARGELSRLFDDRSYFESLRLEPYYEYAAQQTPEAAAFMRALIIETRGRRLSLVHGDYSPKNILVYQGKLVLLDHEVIHFGDPAFDLGFSLAHLLSKAHHLPERRDAFAALSQTYWTSYLAALGNTPWTNEIEARAVRQTLGCLLARVRGRSPLEYLSEAERQRQCGAVLRLIERTPPAMSQLIPAFVENLPR